MAKSTTTPPRKRTTKKKNIDASDLPKPNGSSAPPELDPSEEEIRLRAYHRYLERGGGHGADFEDWLEAERDLKSPRHN
jgi:hypothetical protein